MTGLEAAETERAEGDPLERDDAVADVLEHAADLAVAPLVDPDLEQARLDEVGARRSGAAVVELDAVAQRAERALGRALRVDLGAVDLLDLVARVGQALGERAVVGQQDQARAVGVEPADRVEAAVGVDEPDDGRAAVGVLGGRDDAGRLVEQEGLALLRGDGAAVDLDAAVVVDVARRVGDDLALHLDAPGGDDLLRGPPRGDSGVGEVLGEAHASQPRTAGAGRSRPCGPSRAMSQ